MAVWTGVAVVVFLGSLVAIWLSSAFQGIAENGSGDEFRAPLYIAYAVAGLAVFGGIAAAFGKHIARLPIAASAVGLALWLIQVLQV